MSQLKSKWVTPTEVVAVLTLHRSLVAIATESLPTKTNWRNIPFLRHAWQRTGYTNKPQLRLPPASKFYFRRSYPNYTKYCIVPNEFRLGRSIQEITNKSPWECPAKRRQTKKREKGKVYLYFRTSLPKEDSSSISIAALSKSVLHHKRLCEYKNHWNLLNIENPEGW